MNLSRTFMVSVVRRCVPHRRKSKPHIEMLEGRTLASVSTHSASAPSAHRASVQASALTSIQQTQAAAMPLSSVRSFSYDLADLSNPKDGAAMAQTKYDMLIVAPSATYKGSANSNMAATVATLHADHPGRVVLAYLDIGEAAKFQTYWKSNWKAPRGSHAGNPSFLLGADPYGWSGEYPVAYWNKSWQKLYLGPTGIVSQLMRAGFDGVFLDWIGAYGDPVVAGAAHRSGINPANAMVNFIGGIRSAAQAIDPKAVVVGLNGEGLAADDPDYLKVVDAVAFENTWFSGAAGAQWDDPAGGDIVTDPSVTADRIAQYQQYQAAGKPVFTIDYALQSQDVDLAYSQSARLGFVPLVTQVSLAQLTTTPPPSLS